MSVSTLLSSSSSSSSVTDVNNNEFKFDPTLPLRITYLLNMEECSYLIQKQHAWNPSDSSSNIFIHDFDPLTLHRMPVAESTDCIRTKLSYTKGIHLWKVSWKTNLRGTHAVIGVGSDQAPLHCNGYKQILGNDGESWVWNISNGQKSHQRITTPYPELKRLNEFKVPDEFLMCLDMDQGTLSFAANGQYFGEAFRGLKGKKLFPIVSTVWGHCEIRMQYINGLDLIPLRLVNLCRISIRQKIGDKRLKEINQLDLPTVMKKFLMNHQ